MRDTHSLPHDVLITATCMLAPRNSPMCNAHSLALCLLHTATCVLALHSLSMCRALSVALSVLLAATQMLALRCSSMCRAHSLPKYHHCTTTCMLAPHLSSVSSAQFLRIAFGTPRTPIGMLALGVSNLMLIEVCLHLLCSLFLTAACMLAIFNSSVCRAHANETNWLLTATWVLAPSTFSVRNTQSLCET